MNFENMREWLTRKLAHTDDTGVAAGGTSLESLRQDAGRRTVTPSVLAESPTEIGKVVRYVREQRGWSRQELADLAQLDEVEVLRIETVVDHQLAPRTVVNLADVCGFSRQSFQRLANHLVSHVNEAPSVNELRFAARSNNLSSVSSEDFEVVRALVQSLSEDLPHEK